MAKATVVSIFPYEIKQPYITVIPPLVVIPACKDEDLPVMYSVEDLVTNRYVGEGKSIPIPIIAFRHATAIVRDFKRSLFGASSRLKAFPGVIALDEPVTRAEFLEHYSDVHIELKEQQLRWKNNIIELADNDWSHKKDKRLITRLQVDMANSLGLDKEWARDAIAETKVECPACFSRINPDALICSQCRTVIKPEEYEARFGQVGMKALSAAEVARQTVEQLKALRTNVGAVEPIQPKVG